MGFSAVIKTALFLAADASDMPGVFSLLCYEQQINPGGVACILVHLLAIRGWGFSAAIRSISVQLPGPSLSAPWSQVLTSCLLHYSLRTLVSGLEQHRLAPIWTSLSPVPRKREAKSTGLNLAERIGTADTILPTEGMLNKTAHTNGQTNHF